MSERKGNWILTWTGKQFWLTDPRPEDVCIEDIAHALSNICRFGGHSKRFYSVAEHSMSVANGVPASVKAWGLMHDAAEAYVGDVTSPLKRSIGMEGYAEIENRILMTIFERFGLAAGKELWLPKAVKEVDFKMLMTERRDLMPVSPHKWLAESEPFDWNISLKDRFNAVIEQEFLGMAIELGLK